MNLKRFLPLVFLALLACDHDVHVAANDLDLATIVGHLKQGGDSSAEQVEAWINGTPGVNNVDVDKDGKLDVITVKETSGSSRKTLLLVANPARGEPVAVAELQLQHNPDGTTTVSAAYSGYVRDGSDTFYRESLDQGPFVAWLWAPRPIYYHPIEYYHSYGWASPRPIIVQNQLTITRTTTHNVIKVSPVRQQRPDTFRSEAPSPPRAYAAPPRRDTPAPSTSISTSVGKGSDFSARPTGSPRPTLGNAVKASSSSSSTPAPPSRPIRSSSPSPSPRMR